MNLRKVGFKDNLIPLLSANAGQHLNELHGRISSKFAFWFSYLLAGRIASLSWHKSVLYLQRPFTHHSFVQPKEGKLTRLVDQVGKSGECIGRFHVEEEHCGHERHPLHLKTKYARPQKRTSPWKSQRWGRIVTMTNASLSKHRSVRCCRTVSSNVTNLWTFWKAPCDEIQLSTMFTFRSGSGQ